MSAAAAPVVPGTEDEARVQAAWRALAAVPDPELPALTLADLGIVRFVSVRADGVLEVGLSPTYTGCPATDHIAELARRALEDAGVGTFAVTARARARLEQRLDHGRGAAQARTRTASSRRRRPRSLRARGAPRLAGLARRLSAMPLAENRMHQRIRLDALQGAAPLPRLSGAVRALQVHLTGIAC